MLSIPRLSHRWDGKPTFYILGSRPWGNIRKFGVSRHISKRKDAYITTNPEKVYFDKVFLLNDEDLLKKNISLYQLDSYYLPQWLNGRGMGHLHYKGGGTEFYECEDHCKLVLDLMDAMGIRILDETSNDDEFPPFNGRDISRQRCILEEDEQRYASIIDINTLLSTKDQLLERFQTVFIPGSTLRPYQRELWNIWSQTLTKGYYRGILQWPTGSGKTFAELMFLVLTVNIYETRGDVYRAMIIAPTNDILNTQKKHLRKLGEFGIEVIEGNEGRLSSLTLPQDRHFVLITTHASLTNTTIFETLPPFNHIHYDEVHRITGMELFTNITEWMPKWGTPYLTGTSATPLTSNPIQREKLCDLFGRDFPIIHRVDIDTLVRLGYIAKPQIHIRLINNGTGNDIIHHVIQYILDIVKQRKDIGMWSGGKSIVYLPTLDLVRFAYNTAVERFPDDWVSYMAVDNAPSNYHDTDFVSDPADGTPRILFACEKYREGSDISGIEFTMPLMGRTMAAYIFIQIMGRALRPDYENKEGWCCILRAQYEDETPDDVLEQIILNITAFLVIPSIDKIPKREFIRSFVTSFLGCLEMENRIFDVDETTLRIQRMYIRKSVITFDKIKELNSEMGMTSRADYVASADEHPHYIENPQEHYRDDWTNWYDFLGVDTSNWPSTKSNWKSVCIERGLTTWDTYSKNRQEDLPPNPTELYYDFTSWRDEFPESYAVDEWL